MHTYKYHTWKEMYGWPASESLKASPSHLALLNGNWLMIIPWSFSFKNVGNLKKQDSKRIYLSHKTKGGNM